MTTSDEFASFRTAVAGGKDTYHRPRTERGDAKAALIAAVAVVVVAGCVTTDGAPVPTPHEYLRHVHTPGQVTR
jgi:hypothetical protein